MAKFAKGHKGPGRPKGSENKLTTDVKQALALAFEGIGGVENLQAWGEANQTEFYKLWVKLLPMTLAADKDNPLKFELEIKYVEPK